MADEEDAGASVPVDDEEESGSGSGSGSESEEEQTEWLATTREKRSTAGNRLTSLIQQEGEDDELELLFAEDEDDAGFEDVEDFGSDVQMDSSDDDDDQGPTAGADDLEGEKELQRQAKAENKKKRKANDHIPKAFLNRKKVKIDPTESVRAAPPPRPKKKSERASWIPTAEDAPTRASMRGTTKQSKQQLHAQMVDREKRRLKQLENMKKAAARKEANAPKEITQEDRLVEAARIEKRNARSLNRWEEAERLREEEMQAKLAALHNRKMEGPVISWWSGMTEWVNGRLRRIGKGITIEEKKPAPRKKLIEEVVEETPKAASDAVQADSALPVSQMKKPQEDNSATASKAPSMNGESIVDEKKSTDTDADQAKTAVPPADDVSMTEKALADGSSAQADSGAKQPPKDISRVPEPMEGVELESREPAPPQDSALAQMSEAHTSITEQVKETPTAPAATESATEADKPLEPPKATSPKPVAPTAGLQAPIQVAQSTSTTSQSTTVPKPHPLSVQRNGLTVFTPSEPLQPDDPPIVEHSTRNCLILENFNENAMKNKDTPMQVLFGRTFTKATKTKPPPAPVCVITGKPAYYRDPATTLPYHNAEAYKHLQTLKKGGYVWSSLLQAYVGETTPAKGIPPRFTMNAPPPTQALKTSPPVPPKASPPVAAAPKGAANTTTSAATAPQQ